MTHHLKGSDLDGVEYTKSYSPAHEILVLITYVQKPLLHRVFLDHDIIF